MGEEKQRGASTQGGRGEAQILHPAAHSPPSTPGCCLDPASFPIISDTDCCILILLAKKYLSRYKNKPTANYKLSGLKIYSCLCGGG